MDREVRQAESDTIAELLVRNDVSIYVTVMAADPADPSDLTRMLAHRAGAASTPAREMALFGRLPMAKQKVVADRMRIIDPFMTAQDDEGLKGTVRPVDVAEQLDVSVRSLHRLVKRIREMGPVSALAPTPEGGRKRRSDADAALSKDADDAILTQVLKNPQQSIGTLFAKVREVDPAVTMSTVRRRALALRRNMDPVTDARFGRAWLLDQAALRIPVARADGVFWLTCSFLVDVDTGLICGRAPVYGPDDAGLDAVVHALRRVPRLLDTRLRLANRFTELTWAVPDGWSLQGEAVQDRAAAIRPSVNATVLMAERFRRGSKLSWLLGGAIGAADILIRATPDPRALLRPGDPPPLDEEAALAILDANVVQANSMISHWAERKPGASPRSSMRKQLLERHMSRIVDVMQPALSEVQLAEAQRLLWKMAVDDDPVMTGEEGGAPT